MLHWLSLLPPTLLKLGQWEAEDEQRLQVFENDCLRAIAGKNRGDRCRLIDLWKLLGLKRRIVDTVQYKRLNWFGHAVRRGSDSYVYRAYKEEFHGKKTTRKTFKALVRCCEERHANSSSHPWKECQRPHQVEICHQEEMCKDLIRLCD